MLPVDTETEEIVHVMTKSQGHEMVYRQTCERWDNEATG